MSTSPAPKRSERIAVSNAELVAFGDRLTLARESYPARTGAPGRVLTQAALAAALGVTRSTVAAWETGRNTPTVETVHSLAGVLHVSPEFLTVAARLSPFDLGEPIAEDPAEEVAP